MRRLLLLIGVLLIPVGVVLWQRSDREPTGTAGPVKIARVVPEGTRIRVEVINVSTERGLARRGMLTLRDAGFDVVSFSSATELADTTLVIDRTGHPQWARWASQALGNAPIATRPDSTRYVDLTIWLDGRWRPPAQPFRP